jgi:hypothetical protein
VSRWHRGPASIHLTEAEAKSGFDRVRWAEMLILELPKTHEGRNAWLLNFGSGDEATAIRAAWEVKNRKRFPYEPN